MLSLTLSLSPDISAKVWSAWVVASDYILAITLYPAILMLHHRFIKKYEEPLMKWTCCICCTLWSRNKIQQSPEPEVDAVDIPKQDTLVRQLTEEEQAGKYRGIEQFLGRKWAKWIGKSKIFNLIFFLVLVIVGGSLASQLETEDDTSYESFVVKRHWLRCD